MVQIGASSMNAEMNCQPTPAARSEPGPPTAMEVLQRFSGIDTPFAGLVRRDAVALLVLFPVLVGCYFGPLLIGGRVLGSLGSDLSTYWYPIHHNMGRVLAEGRIPFWNPWLQAGTPLLAATQPGVFFPPNWLLAVMPAGAAFNVKGLLSFWLGMSAMYVLMRRLGRTPLASGVSALVFGFSGFAIMRCMAGHVAFVNQWPYTAACVLCWFLIQERACRSNSRWAPAGFSMVLAALLAVQYFAGHPQLSYLTLLILAGLHVGWMLYGLASGVRMAVVAGTTWLLVSGATALLLAMVQALPSTLYLQHTVRGRHAGWEYYLDQSMPLSNLVVLFAPWAWGGEEGSEDRFGNEYIWEINAYLGATAIVLALFCFVGRRRIPFLCWVLLTGAFAGILLALGGYAPFYRMAFHVLPGLSLFRVPGRLLCPVVFAGSIA